MNLPDRPLIAKLNVRSGNFGPIDLPLTKSAIDELWDSNREHANACLQDLARQLGFKVDYNDDWDAKWDWREITTLAREIATAGERCYILHPD